MIIHNIEQGSEAWFSNRCGKITGTRFASLMMAESTKGFKDLVINLACEIITGKAEETHSNAIMEAGIETEPIARDEYESIFDIAVTQCGFITPDEDHKYFDWIGVSPDGIIPDLNGMIEIKCPLMKTHFEYLSQNRLPPEYEYQVQGQLFVTGFDYCDFMSYVKGMKAFIIRVYPDNELFKEFEIKLDKIILQVKEKLLIYEKYDIYE